MKTLIKWSVEDYHRMIEAGIVADRQVELLEGDIVAVSPEKPEHYFLSDETSDHLKERLQGKAVVRLDGPITLIASEPEPDIAIVRLPKAQYRDRHPHPADIYWIIEYSDSSLLKDLEEKRQIYATAAIPEYWVVESKSQAPASISGTCRGYIPTRHNHDDGANLSPCLSRCYDFG